MVVLQSVGGSHSAAKKKKAGNDAEALLVAFILQRTHSLALERALPYGIVYLHAALACHVL